MGSALPLDLYMSQNRILTVACLQYSKLLGTGSIAVFKDCTQIVEWDEGCAATGRMVSQTELTDLFTKR
jgi:hypothetical protein